MLAAVGALGLGIGRWVVPATDSAPARVYQPTEASTIGRVADITELKLAQMDAADARFRPAANAVASASTGRASGIVELKFAQMDAAEARVGPVAEAVASASTGPASHITQLKFAQMDAADAR
jgi:hypothetical protein